MPRWQLQYIEANTSDQELFLATLERASYGGPVGRGYEQRFESKNEYEQRSESKIAYGPRAKLRTVREQNCVRLYGTPIMSIIDRPKSAAFINRSCNCRVLSSIDHVIVGCFHQSITINRLLLMD